jgi:hypothetical protein
LRRGQRLTTLAFLLSGNSVIAEILPETISDVFGTRRLKPLRNYEQARRSHLLSSFDLARSQLRPSEKPRVRHERRILRLSWILDSNRTSKNKSPPAVKLAGFLVASNSQRIKRGPGASWEASGMRVLNLPYALHRPRALRQLAWRWLLVAAGNGQV